MKEFVIKVLTSAAAVAVAAWIFEGIAVIGSSTADRIITLLFVAAIFAVVNAVIKPIAMIVSLPAIVLTLGLFIFVVNAFLLLLTGWIADQANIGFRVKGFWTAVFGAIVISIVTWIVSSFFPEDKSKRRFRYVR